MGSNLRASDLICCGSTMKTICAFFLGFLVATTPALGLAKDLSEEIVQISPDTYMLTRISRAGMFASMAKLKQGVIRDANAFAESQGKIAIAISTKELPAAPGQWPQFEYQFRVVPHDDPEARRTSLQPRPDVVIESNETITGKIESDDDAPKEIDVYQELIKLDDLLKKGIITDAEFQELKRKVLTSD